MFMLYAKKEIKNTSYGKINWYLFSLLRIFQIFYSEHNHTY